MNLLISILQAAHCRSTHQFFVIDALPLVTSPRAARFASVLLKHHEAYLIGSKDPDRTFRDFRNHVLHVGDNLWGGATKQAEKWYQVLVDEINAQNWHEAAYAAGVLSHYFTDPLMPLHTAQSDKESIVHRPMEWSVTKSYQKIRAQWHAQQNPQRFVLPQSERWLTDSIVRGATVAHSHYDELIDRYDLAAGCRKPTAGLDARSVELFSNLFGMAITGWAEVLQRAAEESTAAIPEMPNRLSTVVAALKMPSAWITKRIESREERAAVQAIFDEFDATGTVQANLPSEVVVVQQERQLDRVNSAGSSPSDRHAVKQARREVAHGKSNQGAIFSRGQAAFNRRSISAVCYQTTCKRATGQPTPEPHGQSFVDRRLGRCSFDRAENRQTFCENRHLHRR